MQFRECTTLGEVHELLSKTIGTVSYGDFGELIRTLSRFGVYPETLAEITGVKRATIVRWLGSKQAPHKERRLIVLRTIQKHIVSSK